MTFSMAEIIERRRSKQYALHRQYINASLARVQAIIGFDKTYTRGEGCICGMPTATATWICLHEIHQKCWANGFRWLLGKNVILTSLKRLDRQRERQVSRVARRLNEIDIQAPETEGERQRALYGFPFSYCAQFERDGTRLWAMTSHERKDENV